MTITKDLIISDNNFDNIYARLLLGDLMVAREWYDIDRYMYFLFGMDSLTREYTGEKFFGKRGTRIEIIPNININRIKNADPCGRSNLLILDDKTNEEYIIYCPFYFSRDYIIKLFKNQFNIEIK